VSEPLLQVEDLRVRFKRADDTIYAVNGISFHVDEGEILGIVGESGSGKSVTMMSLVRLTQGATLLDAKVAKFKGHDLLRLSPALLEDMRGRDIGIVFQDPMTSLNPVMRIGDQISEAMTEHQFALGRHAVERTIALLGEVGIPDPAKRYFSYPHELSGGMRQRVMIAIAIACEPNLLVADEPTTALDVSVQKQILALLSELRTRRHMSIVLITHDFGVATNFCDRLVVLYGGKVMETASVDEFIARTAHPYSVGLRKSVLEMGARGRTLEPIPGSAPTWTHEPVGCPFADRCTWVVPQCRTEAPPLRAIAPGHEVACHRAEEVMARAG
jgi:oligopeptide/dipeptide ABC transporter ATP-binding protein